MSAPTAEIAELEKAYRRSVRTLIGHAIFLGAGCLAAILLRRGLRAPPVILATVFIVALLLFASDITKFFYRRNELRRLRALHDAS